MTGLFKKWIAVLAVGVVVFLFVSAPEVKAADAADVCWCKVIPTLTSDECIAKQAQPANADTCGGGPIGNGVCGYGTAISFGVEHPYQVLITNKCVKQKNYCWCTKADRDGCAMTEMQGQKTEADCGTLCFKSGQRATHFDAILRDYSTDPACIEKDCICRKEGESCRKIAPFATTDFCTTACGEGWNGVLQLPGQDLNKISYEQGGCLQGAPSTPSVSGACWCKNASDVCEKVAKDATGNPILTEQSCITACQVAGAGGKTGRILKFDPTGTEDLDKSNPDCIAAIQAEDEGAKDAAKILANSADKIAQLKAQAKGLNRVSFGSMAEVIGQVISFFTYFIGVFAFVFYIYAGVLWMSAMGASEQIEKAKNIIIWVTMGVGATLASYVVVQFLFRDVLKVI